MTTQTHDSDTCTAGVDGEQCEICRWAVGSSRNPAPDPYSLFGASERSDGQEIANSTVSAPTGSHSEAVDRGERILNRIRDAVGRG